MDTKQMERIARHYLGERLIRVEHTPENKPPFQVVYDSGCSVCYDGMYGNNVEEMCIRIAAELKSRGWVPTHPRLEWESTDRGDVRLCLRLDKLPSGFFLCCDGVPAVFPFMTSTKGLRRTRFYATCRRRMPSPTWSDGPPPTSPTTSCPLSQRLNNEPDRP